jgi:hypothetical protein
VTWTKTALAVATSTIVATVFAAIAIPFFAGADRSPDSPSWLGDALWKSRGLDLIAQALILLVGSLAVMFLLRQGEGGVRGGQSPPRS